MKRHILISIENCQLRRLLHHSSTAMSNAEAFLELSLNSILHTTMACEYISFVQIVNVGVACLVLAAVWQRANYDSPRF
jgi:hypothetical protein